MREELKGGGFVVPLLLAALAYAVAGRLGALLAIPPSYASPLFPAAGIALACVLRWGPRMLPAVALGWLLANTRTLQWNDLTSLAAHLLIASGVAAQAGFAARLVRGYVPQPLRLGDGKAVLRFFVAGGVVGCLIAPSVGTATLLVLGGLPVDNAPLTWFTWWVGDAFGVMIAGPAALALIGLPRDEWRGRRRDVALPITIAALLLGLGVAQVARWEDQRSRLAFERDAATAGAALQSALRQPLQALRALHSVFMASEEVTPHEWRRAARPWLDEAGPLRALAFARRDGERLVLHYVEPDGAAAAVSPDALAAAARSVAASTSRFGPATITVGPLDSGEGAALLVAQPWYDSAARDSGDRAAALRGVLVADVRVGGALQQVAAALPRYLRLCLWEQDIAGGPRVLAGTPDCTAARGPRVFSSHADLEFAGRRWQLRTSAALTEVPGRSYWQVWLFAIVGLLGCSLLGALLLMLSGHARRFAQAVEQRTGELRRQIDERNRTEAALRESEQRLRNILDHAPIGVLYTDLSGHTRDSNPRFREITGYSAEELASMVALNLTHADDRAADAELAERLARGEIPMYRRRKRYRRKDGSIVWVQAIVSLLRDADGRPHRYVGVVEDISEHLKLQLAEDARAAAEASNRAKSEFLSRMSHELRTPLNAMLGFTQLLEMDREQPLSASQRGWTAQAQQAGWHLLHMINDTLDLSRIDSGTLRLEMKPLELASLVAGARSMIEPQAAARGIGIVEPAVESVLAVRGDETRVKQILTNLLSNAVKYNVDRGRVTISAHAVAGSMVEITVADTGPGLDEQQLSQLFQPFNRLGREGSGIEGTGIGLVISQRLAELMGGALRARSTPGTGSSFVLSLPLAVDIDPTAEQRHETTLPELPQRYRRRSVLYIEDNETNAEVMRGILWQRPQIELRIAATAAAAFKALREHELPDLILLDMHLPDMDGLDLLQQLKLGAATAPIPVVAVSADATRERMRDALADGAELYLTKPVNVAEMLAAVDDLLEKITTQF
jgi:PAS domain S-box-containing protein